MQTSCVVPYKIVRCDSDVVAVRNRRQAALPPSSFAPPRSVPWPKEAGALRLRPGGPQLDAARPNPPDPNPRCPDAATRRAPLRLEGILATPLLPRRHHLTLISGVLIASIYVLTQQIPKTWS